MFQVIWPIGLIVLSNVFYNICAKEVPDAVNPFASLIITYLLGAFVSLILFFITNKDSTLPKEFSKVNWASFILGLSIIGLEAGYIYAYNAGWPISVTAIIQAVLLAIILIFVGVFLYKESLSWNKIAGIAVCVVGLVLINLK